MIVTGLNGTVAPVLARDLQAEGHEVLGWDRGAIPPDDARAVADHVLTTNPAAIVHLATGSPQWAETLARAASRIGARFMFTSSVAVFGPEQQGPFSVDAVPEPADDYGRYKLDCERRVLAANPAAVVVRLGWQIGQAPGSNNMVDYLTREHQIHGRVEASDRWLPACSFLPDTAAALASLLERPDASGIYHLEGNPGLSFFEIATRLNALHGGAWNVVRTDAPLQDQRLNDSRVVLAQISRRL